MGKLFTRLIGIGALCIVAWGCGSVKPAMPNPVTEPVIEQPGENIVRYRDRVIEVVVETGFADNSLGDPWLMLNVSLSGMTGAATEVDRRLISVRTPDGSTIPLPSYKEFSSAYDEYASIARRASLASPPLAVTRGGRRPCSINFMPLPGSGVTARKALHVNRDEVCVGHLYFPVRGGVQPGRWKLILEFEETEAAVPFILGGF